MPLVDASSPSLVTGTGPTVTSGTFSPPAGSLIVACVVLNHSNASTALTASFGGTPTLTWTQRALRNAADAGAQGGAAQISTAPASTGTHQVSATNSGGNHLGLKLFVVTAYTGTGASGEGSSTTNAITPTLFTVSGSGSLVVVCGSEWNALGNPTSSDLTLTPMNIASQISGAMGYKNGPASGSATANLDAAGTGAAAWNWCAIEITASATATSVPPLDVRRRAMRPLLVR